MPRNVLLLLLLVSSLPNSLAPSDDVPTEFASTAAAAYMGPLLGPLAGALYAGSLWLSNSAYLHLSVSFIQMTKSLMPGLVYAAGVVLGNETWRRDLAGTMALIAAGVVVCAVGEVALVPLGLVQQLAALVFEVGTTPRLISTSACAARLGGLERAGAVTTDVHQLLCVCTRLSSRTRMCAAGVVCCPLHLLPHL